MFKSYVRPNQWHIQGDPIVPYHPLQPLGFLTLFRAIPLKFWWVLEVVSVDLAALSKARVSVQINLKVTEVIPRAVGSGLLDHAIFSSEPVYSLM